MRKRDESDVVWVAELILGTLRLAGMPNSAPVKRDRLVQIVGNVALERFVIWKPGTASRRVRDALHLLRQQGHAVVSNGAGFKLASTAAERHQAAERMRKTARTMFAEADRLEKAPVAHELVQREMFEAVV